MGKTGVDAVGAREARLARQLRRLEVLTDVVFGLVLWWIVIDIPAPDGGDWAAIVAFLQVNRTPFLLATLAVVIVIIYWLQSNMLFGYLGRTDSRHTAIAILQLFFLLLFLYSVSLGVDSPGVVARVFESATAAMVGFAAFSGWAYAMRTRRLLSPEITDDEAAQIRDRTLAEPLTALITLPCAFIAPLLWEVAWLSYVPVGYALRVRRRRKRR